MKKGILLMVVFSLFILSTLAYAEKTITLDIGYGDSQLYDTDNDGIESLSGVIDFSVDSSSFNWDVDYSFVATKWEVYSVGDNSTVSVCFGSASTCSFIGLSPVLENWDDSFYLYYGHYGATNNNIVSARVIYANYTESADPQYSDVVYSDMLGVTAEFVDNVYSVTESSFVSGNFDVTINNPDNISETGEIYLNFTVNSSVNANYTFNGNTVALGSGYAFVDRLNGSLPYAVLDNGNHSLIVNISDGSGNNMSIEHDFVVDDGVAPVIEVYGIVNGSIISSESISKAINISSDEYSFVSYKLNSDPYSSIVDLGEDKREGVALNLSNGANMLLLNATDMHNNSFVYTYQFTLNYLSGNCSDALQNYHEGQNETGIDCGGPCSSCVDFTVSADKSVYNSTDDVKVTVVARANSYVNVTLKRGSTSVYADSFTPVFSGAPISEQRVISGTSEEGSYTLTAVMHYLNITETKTVTFSVVTPANPISVSISANATTVNRGDVIALTSTVSGTSGSVSYRWDFDGDGTWDSAAKNVNRSFGQNGTFTVRFNVTDSVTSKAAAIGITVRDMHSITFYVRDNATKSAINKAQIKFFGMYKNTSSDGKATFVVPDGTHDLKIEKEGYVTISRTWAANNNGTVYFNLTEVDNEDPRIEVVSPGNNEVITDDSVEFQFKVYDSSSVTCRLFFESGSDWWMKKGSVSGISDSNLHYFIVDNVSERTYAWKIECTDAYGNTNATQEYSVIVEPVGVVTEFLEGSGMDEEEINEIASSLESALSNTEKMNARQTEAADALNLKKNIQKAITTIKRANRDINNLVWRRLNESEREIERQKLIDRIKDAQLNTPVWLEVLDEKEFVKYPSDDEVENLSRKYLEVENAKLPKNRVRAFTELNQEMQSMITITSKSKIVELEYINGAKETITLIHKEIEKLQDTSNASFYEVIPKSIAADVNDTVALFDYEIFERDPIVKVDISELNSITYYVRKKLDLSIVEDTKSILLSNTIPSGRKSSFIGLAVLDDLKSNFMSGSDKRLTIEIMIIIVLVIIYFLYSPSTYRKIISLFKKKMPKEVVQINEKIEAAKQHLKEANYEIAKGQYKEINELFKSVPKDHKTRIYGMIVELGNELNTHYIQGLVDKAVALHSEGKRSDAQGIYSKISGIYKKISKEYKAKVHEKCIELHNKLSASTKVAVDKPKA